MSNLTDVEIDAIVKTVHDRLCYDGGATVSLNGREVPDYGYLVGDGKHEYVTKTVTYQAIRTYIAENAEALSNRQAFLGVWQSDDAVYFDVSIHIPNIVWALNTARTNGEKAIYDIERKTCIGT